MVTPVVLPPNCTANVIFTVDGGVEGVLDSACPAESSECDLWKSSRTATSVGGVTTDNRLSQIYSLIRRWTDGRVGQSGLSAGNV